MSGTFDGKFVIDKLSESNYGIWSLKVEMMLMKDELWGLTVDTELLSDSASQAQQSAYARKVAKATTTIGPTIRDSFLLMIDDRVTLKRVCDAKNIFCQSHFHMNSSCVEGSTWPVCPKVCPKTFWVVLNVKCPVRESVILSLQWEQSK